jgi:transcription initiation factor IIE alpha subunit
MEYFRAEARCPECRLTFRYAVTEEDIEDGSAFDVMCPRCGEQVDLDDYVPCSEEAYDKISDLYEELEDRFGLEEYDDDDEDEDFE